MGHSIEFVEVELEIRADVDICAFVFGAVAILWCRKDCAGISHDSLICRSVLTSDTSSIMLDLIAFHSHLVTSDNGIEAIGFTESFGDIGPEL